MDGLSVLRVAGVMDILLYLLPFQRGRRKTEIRADIGLNPSTAVRAQRAMIEAGFLKGIVYRNANTFALTQEGRKIALHLHQIKGIMSDLQKKGSGKLDYDINQSEYKPESRK